MTHTATLFEDEKAPRGSTPLMRQYYAIKDQHPNAILLFRMGDFYETFAEDARTVADVLGITLTKRSNGKAAEVALAGFPHHALDAYLPKLVRAGLRVAVCEQLEDPKQAKTIVKRGVTEIITPGVSFRDELLDPHRPNYVAALCTEAKGIAGAAFLEASTGDFFLVEGDQSSIERTLAALGPTEILLVNASPEQEARWHRRGTVVTGVEDWCVGYDFAYETLTSHFRTNSLKGFGVEDLRVGIMAAGAVLHYVTETQKGRVPHIRSLQRFRSERFMLLDEQTRRNLDLDEAAGTASLIRILDRTRSPMGSRLYRRWMLQPLLDVSDVNERLDAVDVLVNDAVLRRKLQEQLGTVGDIERLTAKNETGRSQPRDLVALANGLAVLPTIMQQVMDAPDALSRYAALSEEVAAVASLIHEALVDEPSGLQSADPTFRAGYSAELDEVRDLAQNGKAVIAAIQQRESTRTGIPSLKVGFNKVFGYYLEVTNTHKDKVPADYIRKQTLVNAERYVTPELKETEERILNAQERIGELEAELFQDLRSDVAKHSAVLMKTAGDVAVIDALSSFAVVSAEPGFVKPDVDESRVLAITNGRHPVVEASLPAGEPFIPNSVSLDTESDQILVITGPNMAGKSVILRQTGIIVLLAQVGCFVPAESARIGIVDRIFTRVGASDNLAEGESTFLVEMNETANILNNASNRSLILLDEVGRGTSTFDGLSIAWSIVEYLHEHPGVAAKTLFATHYHELNELANRLDRVRNYRVLVQEHGGRVIFLRKLVAGGADHSYGIEVARMAGLPTEVLDRAREVLDFLEQTPLVAGNQLTSSGDGASGTVEPIEKVPGRRQSQSYSDNDVVARRFIESLDLNRLTPIEALVKLNELKDLIERK